MSTKKFVAKITPQTIEKGNTKGGVRYSAMKGATVEKIGRGGKPTTMVRTVMAFGPVNASIANFLRAGRTVELECSFDGGTIRVEGRSPNAKTA